MILIKSLSRIALVFVLNKVKVLEADVAGIMRQTIFLIISLPITTPIIPLLVSLFFLELLRHDFVVMKTIVEFLG